MSEMAPNHICKNENCTKGNNGKPKQYYTCGSCDTLNSWRSVACSVECYKEYVNQVVNKRVK